MNEAKQRLWAGAEKMKIPLTQGQGDALMRYLALIMKWNKHYNLSAITEPIEAVDKHLLDSLSILPYISNQPLLDIGSGAGLPGIVLAIMRGELSVFVLDSVGKKCRFMRFVKAELALDNLSVIHERLENLQVATNFAQITSRAFASTEKTLALSAHLLCDNGRYLLMKGANFSRENLPSSTKIRRLAVPNVSNYRYLLEINKQ